MTEQSIKSEEMKIAGPHPGIVALGETMRLGETWEERLERRFKDMNRVLTPEHTYWIWFVNRLTGPEGTARGEDGWTCDTTQKNARKILERMVRLKDQDDRLDIDIEKTLDWMADNGGSCDCKILFNVDPEEEE
jgi:hypothetical protein